MAVSRKRLGRIADSKTREKKSARAFSKVPDYSTYPQAPSGGVVERAAFTETAAVISAMKSASSRTTIQKELQKIEDEFRKRSGLKR